MQYHKKVLSNGLRVITVPTDGVASATVLVMVGAGSRYEEKGINGISHFLEHMAFKGTKKHPTALEIATLFDSIGAESNAFTSKEYTGYYIKSASQHIDLSLDILSDLLSNMLLDEKEIDKERGVIIEEINMYEDSPMRKIGDIYENLMYGDTPLGRDISGPKDVIRSITRADFVSYMKSLYSAHNMTVVVVGNFKEEEVLPQIEKYFGGIGRHDITGFAPIKEIQNGPIVTIKNKKTEQAHFALGARTIALNNEKKRYPLEVLATVLGGGMSSRLFQEVREERGLAYYVRAHTDHYLDAGYLAAFAGVDPGRINESISITFSQMKKVAEKMDIKKDEIDKAKEYMKGHFVLELEDTRSVAIYYAMQELLEEKMLNPDEEMAKIDAVTLEEVEAVAKEFLDTKNYSLALIGDFDDPTRFEKLIS